MEALDNVRFLSTLERHFKTLAFGTISAMTESLPSLLNGLRMVWLISRHYNTDETMTPLLRRIVNELVERITSEVGMKPTLRFARNDPAAARALLLQVSGAGFCVDIHCVYSRRISERCRL